MQPNADSSIREPTIGKVLLASRGFFKQQYWYWICIGALLGFSLLFNLFYILSLTFLSRKASTFVFLLAAGVSKLKLIAYLLFAIIYSF